jgi:glucoamylase
MPRDLPIGNGNMLVAFDRDYNMRELYFPHIGEENQTLGGYFRLGIWVNGQFGWIPNGWELQMDYQDTSLITQVTLLNQSLGLRIVANDLVDFHENLYLKKLEIENLSDQPKEIRLFFTHDFCISGNSIGDTAEYRPEVGGLLHYKSDRYFLANAYATGKYGFDQFATGNKYGTEFEGTWKDAEDGVLSGNPIAQGSVDSVGAVQLKLEGKSKQTIYYWIACGKTWGDVSDLNDVVKKKGPEELLIRTKNYWHLWVNKESLNESLLPEKVIKIYKRSLLVTRTQINNCGSIIAGNDSDVMKFNRDTYSYMWPRDGAMVAYALDLAKYALTGNFYRLCNEIISKEGFFLHKYTPSGSLASSWHPWYNDNKAQLPIQEDETALVIWSLWNHYEIFRDIEFIKPLYRNLIRRAGDFMMSYRSPTTGLPLPSYDLWEERRGVLTFTVSTVYAGLIAAAKFASAFGEVDTAKEYRDGAAQIKAGMDKYLYLENEKRFARMVNFNPDGSIQVDATVDASLYATFAFGVYAPEDEKVKSTMAQVYEKLWNPHGGGLARYEGDTYFKMSDVSNPWFVTTLWLAQYHIALAKDRKGLEPALNILEWVADHALPSGVLAEQVHPITHEPLSVSPLTWSHGTYIAVVNEYLNKLTELEQCPTCGLSKIAKYLQQ